MPYMGAYWLHMQQVHLQWERKKKVWIVLLAHMYVVNYIYNVTRAHTSDIE